MKKSLILSVLIILTLLIPPYFIGATVEKEFRNQLSTINTNPSINLSVKDYQRGWFESVATLDLSIQLPPTEQGADEAMTITMTQAMQHGPFLWTANSFAFGLMDGELRFNLPADWQTELEKNSNWTKDTLKITGRTGFDLATRIELSFQALNIQQGAESMAIAPAHGVFSYDQNGHVTGQFQWQGLSMQNEAAVLFKVGSGSLDLDQQLVHGKMFSADSMFAGKASAMVESLMIQDEAASDKFAINKITVTAQSTIQDTTTDFKVKVTADSLQAMAQEFKNFIYDFTLENLDTEAVKELNRIVSEAQMNPSQDPMETSVKLQNLLPKLIEQGPLLKINQIAIETAHGNIDTQLQVSIDQSIYDANNPASMMMAIDAAAEGFAPEAFFVELGLAQDIEQLVMQNLLVREEQTLKFNFIFKNGQAQLNGSTIPLGAL